MDTTGTTFADFDWIAARDNWTSWWKGELDRCLVVMDLTESQRVSFLPHFEGWDPGQGTFPVDPILDYYEDWFCRTPFYGDSFPRLWLNFGAGILAAALGACVRVDSNTIWFEPAAEYDWEVLSKPLQEENFWWQWISRLTEQAVNRWQGSVAVGRTDLGGGLDILASLRGTENILMDMMLQPEWVGKQAARITQRWLEAYNQLETHIPTKRFGSSCWAPMWCPGRYYMLQSDLSYMISPEMFERFVMPDLESISAELDYAFYHLDGKGQLNHLDLLLAMENLDGIQWVPGDGAPPPEEWLEVLQRIRSAGKLCQLFVTPAGARKIVHELGPKGFAFMINPPPREEDIPGLLADLDAQIPK